MKKRLDTNALNAYISVARIAEHIEKKEKVY